MQDQRTDWPARDRERRELARRLQAELEPALLLLVEQVRTYQAVLAAGPRAASALDVLASMAAAALGRLHEIAADLEAREVRDLGLIPALEILALRAERRYGLAVRLSLPGPTSPVIANLGAGQALAAYRIAQQAMHNAGQHAAAGQLEVGLQVRGERLLLSIADDGRGFSVPEHPDRAEGGLGEMAARAASAGGELEVSSLPGVGTQVRATVPLSRSALDVGTRARAAGRTFEPLTSREREVLTYVAQGMTNKQIAAAIGISDRTVQFHLGNVLGKLDAASRTEAVVTALSEGLI